MASYLKALTVWWVFSLVQIAVTYPSENSSNSVESSEEDVGQNSSPAQKVFIYTFEHFVPVGKNFAKNAYNVSQSMLKSGDFTSGAELDVVDFTKNLTEFVHKYDTSQSHIYTGDILNIYSNMTYYYQLPTAKLTEKDAFISKVLEKYSVKTVVENFVQEFAAFKNGFVKLFEENKAHLEQTLQDWYKDFNTLKVFKEQFNAVSNFLKMA